MSTTYNVRKLYVCRYWFSCQTLSDLCCGSKGMSKINPDGSPTLQVDHKVGEMSVSDSQHIVAHTEGGVGAHKVGAQSQECFGGRGELEECTAADRERDSEC